MKNKLSIDIEAKLTVSEETANIALKLVEIYCNENGTLVMATRQPDGEYAFEWEGKK